MRNFYRIDKTRWRLGSRIIETGIHKPWRADGWNIGFYIEHGGYGEHRKGMHFALGPFYFYSHKEAGYVENPTRYGFNLGVDYWQRWWGRYSFNGHEKDQSVFCGWRDNLISWIFGKTEYTKWEGPEKEIKISMPEGDYPAKARHYTNVWFRKRWPFHRVMRGVDVEIEKGIPFQGKGENSWDCGDDGLFGYGYRGLDFDEAAQYGAEIVLKNREKYGEPSSEAIRTSLGLD